MSKKYLVIIATFFTFYLGAAQPRTIMNKINYDDLIILDAENLAEQGINEAYEELIEILRIYVKIPEGLTENLDNNLPSYSVTSRTHTYAIYGGELPDDEGQSWGRATYALFSIVNEQLKNTKMKLYAINGGNELGGLFLTQEQYGQAIATIERKTDWPYIPTEEHPWYGQPH